LSKIWISGEFCCQRFHGGRGEEIKEFKSLRGEEDKSSKGEEIYREMGTIYDM